MKVYGLLKGIKNRLKKLAKMAQLVPNWPTVQEIQAHNLAREKFYFECIILSARHISRNEFSELTGQV